MQDHTLPKEWFNMENKRTFGAYTCRRRKEPGLIQREFADGLFVTEPAVSEWERNMSYPDVTLVRDIYAILQVSEHELLTASEDIGARTAKVLAKKYLSLLRRLRWIQYILYSGTALTCLVCNLTVGHTLGWFWLVLAGELVGASLTPLPILVKQHRGVITLGDFALSLELLLLAVCLFSRGDWLLLISVGVLLGLGAAFLPGALQELPRPLGEHKAMLYLGTETLLLCALLWVSRAYGSGDRFSIPTLSAVLFGLTLPWAQVLICRYAPINRWWKGMACLGATCVFLPLINPVTDWLVRLGSGTVERLRGFRFRSDFTRWVENWYLNESVLLLLQLVLAAAVTLYTLRALLRHREA